MKQTCIRRIHRTWCASRYTESLDLEEPRSTAAGDAISIAQAFVGWKTKHAAGAPGCRASGVVSVTAQPEIMQATCFNTSDCTFTLVTVGITTFTFMFDPWHVLGSMMMFCMLYATLRQDLQAQSNLCLGNRSIPRPAKAGSSSSRACDADSS